MNSFVILILAAEELEYPLDLTKFCELWTSEEKKKKIQEVLASKGIDLEAMKADQHMSDVDDFDFICHVAFDKKPLTRKERANNVKKRDFLSKYSGVAREVLEALLEQYMNVGIYELGRAYYSQNQEARRPSSSYPTYHRRPSYSSGIPLE